MLVQSLAQVYPAGSVAVQGAVVALGNFDGFHKGHQAVVGAAAHLARGLAAPLAVLTFSPHPARFFKPDLPPFTLTTPQQKEHYLKAFGVDYILVLPFSKELADLSPQSFVTDVLKGKLQARQLVCGHDFTFGKNRAGQAQDLERCGVGTSVVPPVMDGAQPFSSTLIRAHLSRGQVERAAEQLGRWWRVEGCVERGDARGRQLGFPTANLSLGDYQRPAYGVYAVRATVRGRAYEGVANIGLRPSFQPPREVLEVHLFDFEGDIYGEAMAVDWIAFIRAEQAFGDLALLKAQITADRATAAKILRQPTAALNRFPPQTRADFESQKLL